MVWGGQPSAARYYSGDPPNTYPKANTQSRGMTGNGDLKCADEVTLTGALEGGGRWKMMEITIRVPDELGKRLRSVQERLPELLERALAEEGNEIRGFSADEQGIVETLTQNPSPQVILDLKPSPSLQARISDLLERNKKGELTRAEEFEMERYLTLEHWVRLAKAHAYQELAKAE